MENSKKSKLGKPKFETVLREILETAAETYGDPFPMTIEEAKSHSMGDTLAEFARIELEEVLRDEMGYFSSRNEVCDRAAKAMEFAASQLDEVAEAVRALRGDDNE